VQVWLLRLTVQVIEPVGIRMEDALPIVPALRYVATPAIAENSISNSRI
jgi:hypothetical protein